MTRITEKERATIVRLFANGTSIMTLSVGYGLSMQRIEGILRDAMKMADVQP